MVIIIPSLAGIIPNQVITILSQIIITINHLVVQTIQLLVIQDQVQIIVALHQVHLIQEVPEEFPLELDRHPEAVSLVDNFF
tara:strand:- start:254 stop:499 length:246 start_codon:yes stop_codon:yes gene_type:complete